ncbi:MAG: peptidoglycan recognition family protein [Henriciella sp.]|uniref:N-acetylmuramoyl-L-alanine amidase n=1 Tax=Henriciella sp. TaxID=1968823 RepID=UPI003C75B545
MSGRATGETLRRRGAVLAIGLLATLTGCQASHTPPEVPVPAEAGATPDPALPGPNAPSVQLDIDRLPEDFVHTGGEPRDAAAIDMIVIHTIGGPLCEGGAIRFADITRDAVFWRDWFLAQDDKSIHYIVGRDGDIAQQRPDLRTAGHVSYHGIKPDVNKRSIGIELINDGDGEDPFPAVQIEALTALVKNLSTRYSLGPDDIHSHSELDPRKLSGCGDNYRRVDPGPLFPMDELKAALANSGAGR